MAWHAQCGLVAGFGCGDGFVELGVDFGGESVGEGIELFGEAVFIEVERGEVLAHVVEFLAYFAYGGHVGSDFDAEFLTEHVDKLDGGSCRAAAEPPYIGVENVDAVEYGHQ